MRRALALLVLALAACSPRGDALTARDASERKSNAHARRIACADVGDDLCLAACPDTLPPREHAMCLLEFRFGTDEEAAALARSFYSRTETLLGVETRPTIEGFRGEQVALHPALPLGTDRHHIEWLSESLDGFDRFLDALREHAPRTVRFSTRPRAFVFFRTAETSFPSAYYVDEKIAYNLAGPLHTNRGDARETMFHELFHLNDAREEGWSERALGEIFGAILAECTGHDCFAAYAPHSSVVDDGTFYAFDPRTGDVREYAAELALRYLLEQERVLAGEGPIDPPFKCVTALNGVAWTRLTDTFFGGADLTPPCETPEVAQRPVTANAIPDAKLTR